MMLFANVAYDPAVWVAIPIYWGPETWDSPQTWGAETAQYRWRGDKPRRRDVERTEAVLAYLAQMYGAREPDGSEVVVYLSAASGDDAAPGKGLGGPRWTDRPGRPESGRRA